jgi:hypothetical protein
MPVIDSNLHRNPFSVLGAGLRDNARRIIELADSPLLDDQVARKARADLTTPRARLAAELGWLPGLSPGKAAELVAALEANPHAAAQIPGLPTLAQVNLCAAAFALAGPHDFAQLAPPKAAAFILFFARLIADLDPDAIRRDINEDRAVAGFPEVADSETIEAELASLERQHRDAVLDGLDRMAPADLVATMTSLVRADTDRGEAQATAFVDTLVDAYQDRTREFLDHEAGKILKLLEDAQRAAAKRAADMAPFVTKLGEVARNWMRVAEPIQLSLKSRGLDDDLSAKIAWPIRNFGVALYNEHGHFEQAGRITKIVQEVFAYVPDVAARAGTDAEALRGIGAQREKTAKERAEWASKITFEANLGGLIRSRLAISPQGFEWKGKNYPLDSITRIRWGAVRHSINGIPTGTIYTVAVGDSVSEAMLRLSAKNYAAVTEKLWHAVGSRLMGEMLSALRDGKHLAFGDTVVDDLGVSLTKRRFLRANERIRCDWSQVQMWSADGSLCFQARHDKKLYSSMSYLDTPNAHLLEHIVSLTFKNAKTRLSALLD